MSDVPISPEVIEKAARWLYEFSMVQRRLGTYADDWDFVDDTVRATWRDEVAEFPAASGLVEQLTEARAERVHCEGCPDCKPIGWQEHLRSLNAELTEARARIERLETAGKAFLDAKDGLMAHLRTRAHPRESFWKAYNAAEDAWGAALSESDGTK